MIRKDKTRISQEEAIIREAIRGILREETLGIGPDRVRYVSPGGSLPTSLYNLDSKGKPTRDPGVAALKGRSHNKRAKKHKKSEAIERMLITILEKEMSDADRISLNEMSLRDTFADLYSRGQSSLENIIKSLKGGFDTDKIIKSLDDKIEKAISENDPAKRLDVLLDLSEKINDLLKSVVSTQGSGVEPTEETKSAKAAIVLDHLEEVFKSPEKSKLFDMVENLPTLDPDDTSFRQDFQTYAKIQTSVRALKHALEKRKSDKNELGAKQGPVGKKKKKLATIPVSVLKVIKVMKMLEDDLKEMLEGTGIEIQQFVEDMGKEFEKIPDNITDDILAGVVVEKFNEHANEIIDGSKLKDEEKDERRKMLEVIGTNLLKKISQGVTVESKNRLKSHLFGDSSSDRTAACAILLLCLTN